jgi:hypothetical protein
MNRFIMQISWIDAKVAPGTMTSIMNALKYSQVPTEIVLLLNEQTFVDKPLEGEPADMWRYIVDHPLYKMAQIDKVTNENKFWGNANFRRDYIKWDGVTYWGEADCYLPLEFFHIAEEFDQITPQRPYVLTFAGRKMWGDWDIIEHPLVKGKNLDDFSKDKPEEAFLRCDTTLSLEQLYEFNANQGDPNVIALPRHRIEGAMTTLSAGLPRDIIAPDIDFFHEDYSLELSLPHFRIPQFHVTNILKGHNMVHPDKRANIFNQAQRDDNNIAVTKKRDCMEKVVKHVGKLHASNRPSSQPQTFL